MKSTIQLVSTWHVTQRKEYETVVHAMLRTAFSSVSFMTIATMQDLLELDGSARMNFPSTLGGNWSWRMTEDQLTPAVEETLLDLTTIYRRINEKFGRIKEIRHYQETQKMLPLKEFVQNRYNKSIAECSNEELYLALLNYSKLASSQKPVNTGKKKVYYISAEFLIGKLLSNNLINLGLYDDVKKELAAAGKDLIEVEEVELEPSLGNGGLGRLAACFIDSIATLGLNGDGVGLNYHFGLFQQVLKNNQQETIPNAWLTEQNWLVRSSRSYQVPFAHFTLTSTLYDIDVPGYKTETKNRLRLFDLDSVDLQSLKTVSTLIKQISLETDSFPLPR